MFSKDLLVLGLLSISFVLNAVHADYCQGAGTYQLSLCKEFQKLRDLAPKDAVIRLVQSHMQSDSRFRKAVKYMLSSEFKETTYNIDNTSIFQSILMYFVRAGVDTTDIKSVGKIFDCILIPIIKEATSMSRSSLHTPQHIGETRSLNTFAQEVSRLISIEELISTLETQVAENSQFAKFYEVVRNPSFRTEVMAGLIDRKIARYVKILRHQQIDLPKLVEYAFNLLYLGPEI